MDEATSYQLARLKEQQDLADKLIEKDPRLHPLTAFIMAGDQMSTRLADEMLLSGTPWNEAIVVVGSYSRMRWALDLWEAGGIPDEEFFDRLPGLWRGADPDDTDPKMLMAWKTAWLRNGRQVVIDERPLVVPPETFPTLTIYRGQPTGAPLGIAWTTDIAVAGKFARGAGARVRLEDGSVYTGRVKHTDVLAFLTGRGESEIIVDPKDVAIGRL